MRGWLSTAKGGEQDCAAAASSAVLSSRPHGRRNDVERQYEFKRIVEQLHGAEPFIPRRPPLVLGIDRKCDTAHVDRYRQSSPAGGQQQFSTQPLSLSGNIHDQTSEPKHRDIVTAELAGQVRRYARKFQVH